MQVVVAGIIGAARDHGRPEAVATRHQNHAALVGAAADLKILGDVVTVVAIATAPVLSAVGLFPGATLCAALSAVVRGDSSGYGHGLSRYSCALVLHPFVILCWV